ncbi:PREDICTED: kin of IRRE-like protein 3 [Dinoponera quadriceps]|uniref:Kin of IRRE-like protein 3 n=1 Tax=Dinoponera quadriceps TaxID=609295 RepID=A0A6P3WNF3_DINQU|nr:PREDICTED: kin of IRRE-like protein 3 [Dinoponera quadriceps]
MTHDLLILSTLLYICCLGVVVSGVQKFIETPPTYKEVLPGQNALLPCRVKDKSGDCFWLKDGIIIANESGKYEWLSDRRGDCSLLIKNATLEFDDNFWVCQVAPSNHKLQDAIVSLPARLLVIVEPGPPILKYEGGKPLNAVLPLKEKQETLISCSSNDGNPAAYIKWYIGNEEREPLVKQKNMSVTNKPKTWDVNSLLRLYGQRENHGMLLRCVAEHQASSSHSYVESRLNIQYSPEVQIESNLQPLTIAPEDSENFLSLKCLADANPAANIKWFKDSILLDLSTDATISLLTYNSTQSNGRSRQTSEMLFKPVRIQHGGMYSCKAYNVIGESASASYRLDVQYKPRLKIAEDPNSALNVVDTVQVGITVEPFECPEFDANPPAQYRWIHPRGKSTGFAKNKGQTKSSSRRLRLERITWSDQGEYRCVAYNTINGVIKETYSERRYTLHVTGPPEIQETSPNHVSIGWIGERAHRLKSRVCSQPPPKLVTWEWGSNQIRAGEHIHPKYEALPLEPVIESGMMSNCYSAQLDVKDLQKEDARMYTLTVRSDNGEDSTRIKLEVRDSSETRIIGVAVMVTLLLMLTLISIGVWALLRWRRRRYRQESEEDGSIAADALYNNGDRQKSINSVTHAKTFARKPNMDSEQNTYDYTHTVKQIRSMSPEALKVRRAPVVLQSPTIV